jgi:hypothetical protein
VAVKYEKDVYRTVSSSNFDSQTKTFQILNFRTWELSFVPAWEISTFLSEQSIKGFSPPAMNDY